MTTILFHITSFLGGGIEKVLIELLWGLDPAKYRIKLSIAHNLEELEVNKDKIPPHVEVSYILDSSVFTYTKKKKVQKTILPHEKLFEELILPGFKNYMHISRLKKLVCDADIIVDYDMTLVRYTRLFDGKQKIVYCHFSLDHYWDGDKRKLDKLAGRLRKYDKVVMLCDEMKTNAIRLYPFLEKTAVRIYNALDSRKIEKLATESIGEYDHLLQDGFFLSAGRLAESQKDFTMLIKGYAESVKNHNLKESLVIIGAGPSRQELEALAREKGVENRVVFAGFQQNPYKWMCKCKLFLFCSKFEGLPTVLIEALTLSCPIIATETPTGVREILMGGKAGILVKPRDENQLSLAINLLNKNNEMKATFNENAEEILEKFEIKYMIAEFERLLVE